MAANAQDEQRWLDGTHPALQQNGRPDKTLGRDGDTDSDSEHGSDNSTSPKTAHKDPAPATNTNTTRGATGTAPGTANTGPKGVLADWAALGQSTTNTGPKGVLSDWRGNRLASAETAFHHLSLSSDDLSNPSRGPGADVVSLGEGAQGDERLDDEDWAKEQYRRRRLLEMKGSGERNGKHARSFGHLREIGIEQFLSSVEDEQPDVAVVVHIYEPEIAACAQLNQHLSTIARGFPRTKFLRALASEVEFATDSEEDTLPTILVYRGGELETTLVRPDLEWGRGTWTDVVALLKRHEAITGNPALPLHVAKQARSESEDSD